MDSAVLDLATSRALNDPARNLFGQHGPRCRWCSGLGRVLRLPGDGQAATRAAARCSCDGTGIDRALVMDHTIASLTKKIRDLERQQVADAKRRAAAYADLKRRTIPKASRQYWSELIAWATADGTPIANTTTEAIIFPNITIPANYMQDGRVIREICSGKLSTTGTPTVTWAIRWNGVAGTVLGTSEAITMGSGVTTVNWTMQYRLVTRSNGATGTVLLFGEVSVHTSSTAVSVNVFGVSGFDAPAAVTVDLTGDTPLSVTADWSAASASNTLTGMERLTESLN
jgi:hypothetical protein